MSEPAASDVSPEEEPGDAPGVLTRSSWIENADAWTRAVREHRIESRSHGTDRAIIEETLRAHPRFVLDVGCGEGWLARALTSHGIAVLGVDGSPPLIERARALGGGKFEVATYEDLITAPAIAPGPFDVIVCNFSLLDADLEPLMRCLGARLGTEGRLVIQTAHPLTSGADQPYVDGWRTETFDAFGVRFPAPMPWYFRTLSSWVAAITASGLVPTRLSEPRHSIDGRPLSLILNCARAS